MRNKTHWLAMLTIVAGMLCACNSNEKSRPKNAEKDESQTDKNTGTSSFNATNINKDTYTKDAQDSTEVKGYTAFYSTTKKGVGKSSDYTYVFNDTSKKFIRTCDARFRVRDVRHATQSIEDITTHFRGYVESSEIKSSIDNVKSEPISADSSLQTTYYTTENIMTLRVPVQNMDSVVRMLNPLIEYLDYRNTKTEDISIELLKKKLEQARLSNYNHRMSEHIDTKGVKLNQISDAEESILNKQEQQDNARLENMKRIDNVFLSTIKLSMYQHRSALCTVVENVKANKKYEPAFSYKIWEALKTGWSFLEDILLFFINIWSILLLIILVVFVFRRYFSKIKKGAI